MEEIKYIGEHLWVGQVGHFFIILSFVASIFSALSYGFGVKNDESSWKSMGRIGFSVHGISVIGLMGIIFYAMYHKYYEYAYVFQHVSDDLPLKYVLSAFWEGQEGSFLLWAFWHIILGIVVMVKRGEWEAPVMSTLAMVQTFLGLMILGIHVEVFGEVYKLGINPTLLLRDTMDIPLFKNADYLSLIKGTGLNPLLQNYWMTIHPPVTFLGFASLTMPFCFAIAGLWKGKYTEWLKPSLGWSLFSGGILGTGILMGALWAYEALSFGGYWSWDPVENAVLVPWLILIAGLHTHLIARSTQRSIRPTMLFYIMAFILIVYSTFLTRSGILGDTSVHAFTEMGLETLLIIFQVFFLIYGLGWFFYRYKSIPSKKEEESSYSREFWMFIGSLVLLFSGILISGATSLPVFNSIMTYFDENYVGLVINDPIEHYNRYQLWIAVLIAILSSVSLFFRYNEKNWVKRKNKILTRFAIHAVVAAVLTLLISWWLKLYSWQYYLLAFTGAFAMVANLDYIISVLKGKLKLGSSAIAHLGFGMMIIGILASGLNKTVISKNRFVFEKYFNKEDVEKYVKLHKNSPMFAQGYWITYESDTLIGRMRYYTIDFKRTEGEDQKVVEEFKLRPNAAYSNDFRKVAAFNPDTKHYLHKDIFTCVVALSPRRSDVEIAKKFEDTLQYTKYNVALGDTLHTKNNHYIIEEISYDPQHKEYLTKKNDFGVSVKGRAWSDYRPNKILPFETALGLQGSLLYQYPYIEEDLLMRIRPGDALMDMVITPENELDYQPVVYKTFGTQNYGGYQITFNGIDKEPKDPSYEPVEGDIAIGAKLTVTHEGKSYDATPIYLIRNNKLLGAKASVPALGLHIRFTEINPENGQFSFHMAKDKPRTFGKIPIELAENIERSDYLILEANIFPGINLFWLGSLLMMLGLFMAWILRYRSKK